MAVVVTPENFEQLRAAYGDDYLVDHDCARIVLCEACGSEGRIYTSRGGPDDYDNGPCPECEGTGYAVVPVEPITEEDDPWGRND
jgi:hypothetical protein